VVVLAEDDQRRVALAGDPAEVIIEVAQARNASLIVLGEHHHSLFAALVGADVSGEVKRRSGADVLVVE
jgi:nucleotide-binding universal stress UspA family protein